MNSKQILKLFISSGFYRAVGSLLTLLVTLVIAKKLGAESSGLYFLGFAIVTFLANVSRLGLDNAVLKLVSINYHRDNGLVASIILSALLIIGFVGLILSFLIIYWSEFFSLLLFENYRVSIVTNKMVPYMVVSSWCFIIAMALQGMQKLIHSIFVTNIIINIFLLLFLWFIDNLSALKVVNILIFSALINLCSGIYFLRPILRENRKIKLVLKELVTLAKPLFIIVLCNQCLLWLGQIVLGIYGTPAEVSNFAVAQRISMLVSFFLMAINLVVAPKYARLYNSNDLASLKKLVALTGRINVAITIPIVLIVILFSEAFFAYFGNGYDKASFALIILALGQLLNAITGSVGYLLSMTGHEKNMRNNSVVSALFMIVLSFTLIKFYGVNGAAIATAFSVALNNFLNLYSVNKHVGVNPLKLT